MKTKMMLKVEEKYKKSVEDVLKDMYLIKRMSPREIDKKLAHGEWETPHSLEVG